MERKTGLGPATPTLARLCSTNWAISAFFLQNFVVPKGISLNASAKVMLFFELTNFSAVFFQKNLFFSHFRPPPLPYTLFIYKKMPTTGPANTTSPATSSTSCWVSSMSASKRLTSCTIYPNWNSTNRLYKPTPEIRMKSTDSNLGFKYANYELFCKHLTIWGLQNRHFLGQEKTSWKVAFWTSKSYFLLLIPALFTFKSSTFSH